jgi:hypothetical protein
MQARRYKKNGKAQNDMAGRNREWFTRPETEEMEAKD